jgi:hypothetical protein
VSTGGGIYPRWRRDSRELFYVSPANELMAVPIRASTDGRILDAGTPVVLFPVRFAAGASIFSAGCQAQAQYAVAADGRFLVNVQADEPAASPITVVLNWQAGIGK